MATQPTDPENLTLKELADGVVEYNRAAINAQQAYDQRFTRLQQNKEEVDSLIRKLQEKIEENEKDSEKSEANLKYYKDEEAKLREKGEKYGERLGQRLQRKFSLREDEEVALLREKLESLEERNVQLQTELKNQKQIASKSIKEKFAMTKKNEEKDYEINMLTDETEKLRQQIELLQQQLENEDYDLHMNMGEEPNSESASDDHAQRGSYNYNVHVAVISQY